MLPELAVTGYNESVVTAAASAGPVDSEVVQVDQQLEDDLGMDDIWSCVKLR
jgi:hypothetical protein